MDVQVVPFSPASGLLEWVEDTIPVHEYLTGKDKQSGAHKRYAKPGNLSFSQAFQTMHKAKRNQLRETFDQVSIAALLPRLPPASLVSCSQTPSRRHSRQCMQLNGPSL